MNSTSAANPKTKRKHPAAVPAQQPYPACVPYLIAFFVPIFCMLIIFAGKEIFPFGDRSFLRTDLYHQYAPFFQEFKDKLSNFDGLFYTWDIGLGTNFMALYAYYLASPINWLLFIWPRAFVIEFITYGIVLRMALSSLTMTWYLNKHNNTNSIGAAFFGIFYSMSGYMAAYSWNIMWLDCLFLFPIIILGLEQLVKKDKCLLYCISLAVCIASNYYISIMICISLVLYFAVLLIVARDKDFFYPKKILNFALYSLIAGGLAAIMLLPALSALSTTASGNFNFPSKAQSYFPMLDMLGRHLFNVQIEIGLDHWPNIYCGVGILFFIPLYLMSKKVSFREKMAYISLLIFFLLSFSLNILNFIWHGFHYPNSLPCRQSFVYIFLLLSMGFTGYRSLKERTSKEILKCLLFAIAFVIVTEKLQLEYTDVSSKGGDDFFYAWSSFYTSIAFLVIYGGLAHAYRACKRKWHSVLLIAVLATIIVESSINMASTSITTVSRSSYVKDDTAVRNIVSNILAEEGSNFVRVEKVKNRTKNDGAWLDYHSASIFSSTTYADLTAIYKKLGLESSTNAYGTTGSSLASNMLLGIKYSLSSSKLEEDETRKLYQAIENDDTNVYMYENTYVLPLGFIVDNQLGLNWDTENVNPAANWNNLAWSLGLSSDLFVLQNQVVNNNTATVSVTLEDSGYIYVYADKSGPSEAKISYNGFSTTTYDYLGRSYFMAAGSAEAGTVITITNTDDNKSGQGLNISAYVIDQDVLSDMYEILNREPLQINHYDSSSVTGTVYSAYGGTMFTSIPYDAGWQVYVDGVLTETSAYENAFLSFPVSAGNHTIEMKYMPEGFQTGLLISLISLILLGAICMLIRQWHASRRQMLDDDFLDEEDDNLDTTEQLKEILPVVKKKPSEVPSESVPLSAVRSKNKSVQKPVLKPEAEEQKTEMKAEVQKSEE